jgi:hypothetical protein
VGVLSIGKLTNIKEGLANKRLPTPDEIKAMVITFGLHQARILPTGKEIELIRQIFWDYPAMDKALVDTIRRDEKSIHVVASRPPQEIVALQALVSKLNYPDGRIREKALQQLKNAYQNTTPEGQTAIRSILQKNLRNLSEPKRQRIAKVIAWSVQETFFLGPEGEKQDIRRLYRPFIEEFYTGFGAGVLDRLFADEGMPKNLKQRGNRILQAIDKEK